MIEFFQRLFGKPPSSATAKERLRLVLLSDHLSLAPDVVEALKHDLVEVISRYVEVDAESCDVTFEQREKQVAMLANIPVLAMRARPPKPPGPPAEPPPSPPEPETAAAAVAAADPAVPAAAGGSSKNGASAGSGGPRRRRRKRPPQSTVAPAT